MYHQILQLTFIHINIALNNNIEQNIIIMKVAFITGITGQDGSYLSEILLDKGYQVWGLMRRSSSINTSRIDHIFDKLHLRYGDLTDGTSLHNILYEIIDSNGGESSIDILEIYNLAAQSHVKVSFELPEYTTNVDALGTLKLLEILRRLKIDNKKIRFYQASTSELFGKVQEIPQKETTPFYPRSPYGIAKLHAYWTVINNRESYGLYACNGILFNHESPRRGHNFVTRKITLGLNKILNDKTQYLVLGNLDAKRDWGHARDYCYGMWLILQQKTPDDYILATSEYHTVREFVEESFSIKGFKLRWEGQGVDEIGYDVDTGRMLVKVDSKYFRPTEVDELLGDASKAKSLLGWVPGITFSQLVKEMVENDTNFKL
jgi:GDPmannose 4,6-dehydratase